MDDRLGELTSVVVAAVTNASAGCPLPMPDVVADADLFDVLEALTVLNVVLLRVLLPDGGAAVLRRLGLVAAGGVVDG